MSEKRSRFSIWIQAIRAPFFTASIIPVFLGAAMAMRLKPVIAWWLLALTTAVAVCLHAGTNLINDYFDYKRGVDTLHSFGSSRVLVEGILTPRQIFKAGCLCFTAGFALGLILVDIRGMPLFILGMTGLIGGYIYTGRPFGLKYLGLGDIMVFLLMGPLLVIGSFFALTGDYHPDVFLASVPVGFFVTAILHANNLRDILHDEQAGITTFANALGLKKSKIWYGLLLVSAYLSAAVLMYTGVLPKWSLLIFLSLPLALKNIKTAQTADNNNPREIAALDVQTAKLHLIAGFLLILSILIAS